MSVTSPDITGLTSEQKRELLAKLLREKDTQPRLAPLSYAQQRLWFLDQLEPGSAAYNVPVAVRLGQALQVGALEQALAALVGRHEVLRTRFAVVGGEPVQLITPPAPLPLPVVDLQSLPEAAREGEAQRVLSAEAGRPFDLARGPLLRALLVRLADADFVLGLTLHHSVSDGWSLGVLLRELATLYDAFSRGQPDPLPPLPLQYADYALWQRRWLQGAVLAEQLAYWTGQLAGAPTVLELPSDHPRPPRPSYRGAYQPLSLGGAATARLRELAQREGATLFMVLLAAFQTLLSRYTGQRDLLVGTPIANRPRRELEGLIGFFVNTLVLRTELGGDPTFREVVRRVRETTLGAYAHQDLPFERLVEELQPVRDPSRNPLFQVMFTLQTAPTLGPDPTTSAALPSPAAGAASEPGVQPGLLVGTGTAKFDLGVALAESEAGLAGVIEYSTDLFEAPTIERLAGHFTTLLEGIAADPEQRLSTLPLLSAAEQQQLARWNATTVALDGADGADAEAACVHHQVEAQVERTPTAVAVRGGKTSLTYRALNARANRLAHALRARGVGPEVRVGLCLERGVDAIVALLAVLKAGGAYVPLDPAYPPERLAFMLADAQVAVLLTTTALAERLPAIPAELLCLDQPTVRADLRRQPATNLRSGVTPAHLAYVIYTSGSTGRPKGVQVEHASLSNVAAMQAQTFNLGPNSRVLQFASLSFDMSIWDIFLALPVGATLCLGTQESLAPGPALLQFLREEAITAMTLQPMALAALPVEDLPALQLIVVGGDDCPADLVARWEPSRQFYNCYGPAETTILSTAAACDGREKSTIGRPIANTQVYVLDRHQQPLPVGVPGELYIGGAGLARGYLGRPDLTAERFVPDPFSPTAGARLYRTGDRVRWRADGQLEFLGRLDEQVKVRGYRIEPGEVESALRRHPAVREALVVAQPAPGGDRRLVAYLVSQEEPPTPSALRRALRQHLPEYLVPSAFVVMEQLPLSPNGKVDRAALPPPEPTRPELEADFVAPRTPLEATLSRIWAEVLGLERVGIHDNFFELGGHSLLVTQVLARVRDILGVEVPLRRLFEAPTIAELAEFTHASTDWRAKEDPVPLEPGSRDQDLPLSYAQQRLWFLDQLEPGSAAYNVPVAVRLGQALQVGALEQALAALVGRHEVLRTRFAVVGGEPVQLITPPAPLPLPVVDLQSLPEAAREGEAQRVLSAEAGRPFDLARGPLLRALLVRLADADFVLGLTLHHSVSDGWSLGVLLRELATLYDAFSRGQPDPLPPLPLQYADYALWQRRWLQGAVLAEQLAYWTGQLAGAPTVLELPSDHPRPPRPSYRGAYQPLSLGGAATARLRELAQREGATLFMVLLAAFQTLLSRYTGQRDLLVGTPIANRPRRELEGLIGFFVNTLVLRTELGGDPTFREVVRRVRETTLGAYAHQDLPFERLVEELQPVRDPSRNPLFQVMFTLTAPTLGPDPTTSAALPSPAAGAASIRPEGVFGGGQLEFGNARDGVRETPASLFLGMGTAKFDLGVALAESEAGLAGVIEYSTDLFEAPTIERLAGNLEFLLRSVPEQPGARLSQLASLLDEHDRQERTRSTNELRQVRLQKFQSVRRRPISMDMTESSLP